MRFTSLALALSALTAVSASTAAALSQNNADAQLVARSGQAPGDSFDFSASRMTKRQIVQNNLKQRKHKRSTGNCKPISSPSQIPSDTPVLVADPSKGSEQSSQPQSSSKPQESTKQPESTKQAEPTKQAQSTNNDNNNNNNNGGGNSGSADAKLGGVSAFQGQNGPGILSWFYTNHAGDSTNGASWCQTSYKDDWMCFAPSYNAMMSNFGYDYKKAAKAYCGREAIIEYNGKQTKAFICDAFDDKWVRSPGSIDATKALFQAVYGSFDGNKNTVGKNVKWWFTGGLVEQGEFQKGKYW